MNASFRLNDGASTLSRTKSTKENVAKIGSPASIGSNKFVNSVAIDKSIYDRLWEPPISCQRRIAHIGPNIQYYQYFPLELKNIDYIHSILRIIAIFVRGMIRTVDVNNANLAEDENKSEDYQNEELGDIVAKFCDILFANEYILSQKRSEDIDALLRYIGNNSNEQFPMAGVNIFFLVHAKITLGITSNDLTKLDELTQFFDSVKNIVRYFGYQLGANNQVQVNIAGNFLLTPDATRVLKELTELQTQLKLHIFFKEQRMKTLGWNYSNEDHAFIDNLKGNNKGANGSGSSNNDIKALVSGSPNEAAGINALLSSSSEAQQLVKQYEESKDQIILLLQPQSIAMIQLLSRLIGMVEDLTSLMKAVSEDAEYAEASRLRALCAAVDNTIDYQSKGLLDNVILTCKQSLSIVDDLKHMNQQLKQQHLYDEAQQFEDAAVELENLHHLLQGYIVPYSILTQSDIVQRLAREGSYFITADFLFTTMMPDNCYTNQTNIGNNNTSSNNNSNNNAVQSLSGLVIKAGTQTILQSIKSWPGFSALSTKFASSNNLLVNNYNNQSSGSPSPAVNITNYNTLSPQLKSTFSQYSLSAGSSPSKQLNSSSNINNFSSPAINIPSNSNNNSAIKNSPSFYGKSGSAPSSLNKASSTKNVLNINNNSFYSAAKAINNSGNYPLMSPNSDNYSQIDDESVRSYNPNSSFFMGTGGGDRFSSAQGFSPAILNILVSFEDLQKQLAALITPQSLALTELLNRLVGMRSNLLNLVEANRKAGQLTESERLLILANHIEDTIDADTKEEDETQCGRGRQRLDNINVIIAQVHSAIKELQRIAQKSKAQRDYSSEQALSTVARELNEHVQIVQHSIEPFSLFEQIPDSFHQVSSGSSGNSHVEGNLSAEINERICREGSNFITSDYIFQFNCGSKNQSIGSLAIVAGAGAILRHIRSFWPGLSALGANNSGGGSSNNNSPLPHTQSYHHNTTINFQDANELRLLGFDPIALRNAGFNDADILTAGFTASELKAANFSTTALRSTGLSENAIKVIGFNEEHQTEILQQFFHEMNGNNWFQCQGWTELHKLRQSNNNSNNIANNSSSDSPGKSLTPLKATLGKTKSQKYLMTTIMGVKYSESSGEIRRLILPANNLSGFLPECLFSLTSLTQLILSENNLRGEIPANIGVLVQLECLCLSHNQFTGEIPKSIKNLQQLTILRLENNQLEGAIPASIGYLTKLKRLDLSFNQLSGVIPNRIGNMVSLQELLLNNNALTGTIPDSIEKLVNLTSLVLNDNAFSGSVSQNIGKLTRLTSFSLQGNPGILVDRLLLQRYLPKCRIKI